MQITIELAQSIANYLMTKPYQEVAALLAELNKQAAVKPDTEAKEDKPKK